MGGICTCSIHVGGSETTMASRLMIHRKQEGSSVQHSSVGSIGSKQVVYFRHKMQRNLVKTFLVIIP